MAAFLSSLGRGWGWLRFAIRSLVAIVIVGFHANVHRGERLFERSLFVQIIETAQSEGFEEEWCGAPILLSVWSELRRARHELAIA
jgi:hypothetical protein